MTLNNISLSQYIVGKLRQAVISGDIIDYNEAGRSSQFSNFIYPDRPMITKLMKNKQNFPRISIESVSQSADHRLGQMSDSYLMKETLKITCYSVRDLLCTIKSSNDSITYDDIETTYDLDNLPFSKITMVTGLMGGIAHTFIDKVDYVSFDSDFDGLNDSIKWLGVDVPDNATDFDISYKRVGTGQEIVRIMAQNLNEYFRKNWRLDWNENKAFNYKLIASNPITFEEDAGLYQYEMTIQLSTFDGLETI